MKTFRFLDFPVYKQAKKLYQQLLQEVESLHNYPLRDQLNRAGLSVILNIAEGSAKKSDKEFAHYLQNAIGSVNEIVAGVDIMHDMQLITSSGYDTYKQGCDSIARQIGGLMKKLYSAKVTP